MLADPLVVPEQQREVTFYSDNRGVRITNSRILLPGEMFVMANITSVKKTQEKPSYSIPIVFFLLGALITFYGVVAVIWPTIAVGLVFLIAGVCLGVALKPTYYLDISSSSGEKKPIHDKDGGYIDKLVAGIHEAIIHRG